MPAPVLSTEPEYAKIEANSTNLHTYNDIECIYSTKEIAEVIKMHNFKRPCIQFYDSLITDASKLSQLIEQQSGVKVFVLADTSYSPCCVDEIAAQHLNADVLFHLGNACLNPVSNIPVYYVTHKVNVDTKLLKSNLAGRKAVIYADTEYTPVLSVIASEDIIVSYPSKGEFIPEFEVPQGSSQIPNRVLSQSIDNLSEYELIYLSSSPSESMMLYFGTTFSSLYTVDIYSPDLEIKEASQFLRKRYKLVQEAKASATIGILVNTLSLRHMQELLEVTKKWIAKADKKYYTFVVGKPNVAKLANFEVIDVWVVLGCPLGGIIVDSSDYIKPIVTPYELKMALTFDWTGKWIIDLEETLRLDGVEDSEPEDNSDDPDAPFFNPVTGKYVNNAPLRKVAHVDIGDKQLVSATSALTVKDTTSTAAEYLQGREWRGLGTDLQDHNEEYAELKMGRTGIARDYDTL